jgi:hypothetical protein
VVYDRSLFVDDTLDRTHPTLEAPPQATSLSNIISVCGWKVPPYWTDSPNFVNASASHDPFKYRECLCIDGTAVLDRTHSTLEAPRQATSLSNIMSVCV